MKTSKYYSRKSFLARIAAITGGVFVTSFFNNKLFRLFQRTSFARTAADEKLSVITTDRITNKNIEIMVGKAFDSFGGIKSFIKKGMNVVIKPNIAWNSTPEYAHNTNPYLVYTVARMCREAGAKVTVFDRTCNSARLSYVNSGIKDAVEKAGANIKFIDKRKFVDVPVPGGLNLKTLSVYKPILDADFVINMPVAKHHGSSQLTISMKNLMGVVGGNRGALHWNLHENIVDFTKTIKVDLIICDCLRILTAHGPNGGSLSDVKETKTILMSKNPVVIDAYATTLFGRSPSSIKYIKLAGRERMGEINTKRMNIERFSA